MKLSDLDPSEVTSDPGNALPLDSQQGALKASQLSPGDINFVAPDVNQAQFGTLPEQGLAGIESFQRGRTLGLSDLEESQLSHYLPESLQNEFSKESIRGREEANPITSFLGNTAGGATLGGLGEMAGLSGLAAHAATGAAFGAGNAISDAALGDPDLNAQKVLADVGMGAALGTGLGLVSKAVEALPAFMRGTAAAKNASNMAATATDLNPSVDVNPSLGTKAKSLEELNEQVQNFKKYGGQDNLFELPVKQEAASAAERLAPEMPIPISDYQIDSLSSQDARNAYKTSLEVPGKNGEILRNATGAQKKSLDTILDNTIGNLAPDYEPTSDAHEAGTRAADAFTDVIQANRDRIGPAIQAIKNTPLENVDHLPGMINYLTDISASPRANPKIANMFDTADPEKVAIKPYNTGMGIDQATYRSIKQAVTSLQENPEDFEKLFDIRKGLDQNIDITKLGSASKEIGNAKAAMMDYIQDAVQRSEPDTEVRQTFADYAKNEENAQLIERKFGAQIGTDNFRSLAKGKAEEGILRKIFSDSATTQAAKNILPPEKFNQLLADHLSILKNDSTDKGLLSANKFYTKIAKGNSKYALDQSFSDNPASYQKLKDILTVMRTFTDDTPQNPSGTTKTLFQALINGGIDPFKHIAELGQFGKEKFAESKAAAEINAKMAGQADQNAKLKTLENIINRINTDIKGNVKDIFSSDTLKGAALSAGTQLSDKSYEKISKQLGELSSNPNAMMDHMATNTEGLHKAAPNITQSINNSLVSGLGFLQSKQPQAPQSFPLSQEWKPSKAQLSEFGKYYSAVDKPLSALKQVNNGTLSNETMEALQIVHPQLLAEMRQQVISHMNIEKAKQLDYGKKVALAKFLGQPLDQSMTSQMIQSTQMMYNPPPMPAPRQRKLPLGGLKQIKLSDRTSTTNREED